jgi:hypothetical protein
MLNVANKTIFLCVTMLSVIMLTVMAPLPLLAAVQLHRFQIIIERNDVIYTLSNQLESLSQQKSFCYQFCWTLLQCLNFTLVISIITFSIMTLIIMTLSIKLLECYIQHDIQKNGRVFLCWVLLYSVLLCLRVFIFEICHFFMCSGMDHTVMLVTATELSLL